MANTVWGIHVRSLDRDETLFQLNDHTPLIPASVQKILTLAAAVKHLGWDYRYKTEILSTELVKDGTVEGDLVVRGNGDPTIHAPDGPVPDLFSRWASTLKALGIERIHGRLIGDDDALDGGKTEPWTGLGVGWSWNDIAFGFATPGSALQYRENVVKLTVTASSRSGGPVAAHIDDLASGIRLVNRMVTGDIRSQTTFTLRRLPGHHDLVLQGSIPAGTRSLRRMVSVNNPTAYFVNALKRTLTISGISVSGNAIDIDDLPRQEVGPLRQPPYNLAVHHSPPLSKLAVNMMKNSQNLYAETVLRSLGEITRNGSGQPGKDIVSELLNSWGVTRDQFVIADGSGLSRYNLVTASALVRVLAGMRQDPRDEAFFLETLPLAGYDGTLKSRMVGTPAEGNARGKTGTMTGVRTLAGYVETADGERLAFAILANNFLVPSGLIIAAIDRVVAELASFSRR